MPSNKKPTEGLLYAIAVAQTFYFFIIINGLWRCFNHVYTRPPVCSGLIAWHIIPFPCIAQATACRNLETPRVVRTKLKLKLYPTKTKLIEDIAYPALPI